MEFNQLIAIGALIALLVMVIAVFLQGRNIQAVTQKLHEFEGNPAWMNAVEQGVINTVPVETVKDIIAKFDTFATLVSSLLPAQDQRDLIAVIKTIADKLADGQLEPAAAAAMMRQAANGITNTAWKPSTVTETKEAVG